jgi:hypothetical protein
MKRFLDHDHCERRVFRGVNETRGRGGGEGEISLYAVKQDGNWPELWMLILR